MTVAYEQDWCFGRPQHWSEPKIELTVEEAKKWMRILKDNAPYLDCLYESSKDDYDFLQEISERIEQAERTK